MTDTDQLTSKLDIIIGLLSAIAITGKQKKDAMESLSLAGLAHKDIAKLLNTTPLTIRVELSKLRKSKKKKAK